MARKLTKKTRVSKLTPKTKKAKTKAVSNLKLELPRIKIKIIGLGGGGSSIVSEISQKVKGVNFIVADTDQRVFKRAKKGIKVFQFGKRMVAGMGTGLNASLAQKAAEEDKEKLSKLFEGQNISIFIVALGGGVGSGAISTFAQAAKEKSDIVLGIFTLPFSFEGEKKMKIAKSYLEEAKKQISGSIVVPNETILEIIDDKTPLKKALSMLNQVFADWIKDLVEIISKPGLINVDFADLKSVFPEFGNEVIFKRFISQGENRAEEMVKSLEREFNVVKSVNPAEVKSILYNIAGGKDLALEEVKEISKNISKINPKAKIIFGISQDNDVKGKIKLTLLVVKKSEGESELKSKKILKTKKSEEEKREKKETRVSVKQMKAKRKEDKKEKLPKPDGQGRNGLKKSEKKNKPKMKKRKKIRRSALEIKKNEEEQEELGLSPETEWEIPAFLRKK